jgi:hypothetical protein
VPKIDDFTVDYNVPLWASIIMRGLKKGHKFYYSSGNTGLITDLRPPTIPDGAWEVYVTIHSRPFLFKIWLEKQPEWTLKRYKDGFELVEVEKDDTTTESVDDATVNASLSELVLNEYSRVPLIVSLMQKITDSGQDIYMTLGELKYYLISLAEIKPGVWGGEFTVTPEMPQPLTTPRVFKHGDESNWQLKRRSDGWELSRKFSPDSNYPTE